jgi:hypothetical protein
VRSSTSSGSRNAGASTPVDDTPFDYAPLAVLGARSLAMLSAALRHVRDAERLISGDPSVQSPDQAFHLAGSAQNARARPRYLERPSTRRSDMAFRTRASSHSGSHS